MALKSTKDHWAFLEEIEAPMWVDLTVENTNYEDIDDAWFHTSHMFHQCSSHQLKATFAHSGEGSLSSGFDLMGPSSPNLPSSVSRSRGKYYKSSEWRGEDCDLLLNKQHPVKLLNRKPSTVKSGCGEEIKPKLSFVNSKGTSRSKISLASERGLTGHAKENILKTISSHGGSESSPTSMGDKVGQSNESTVTSKSDRQPHQTILEISSRALGTSGLLSAIRISLRKSYVTRQASRVEVNNDRRQSRDHTFSSSKSSVGSSSNQCNLVGGSTTTLMQNKDQTPDSRNVARMTEAARKKVKASNVLKASNVQVKEGICNSRRGIGSNVTKSTLQGLGKSKVQNHSVQAKALLPHRINNQCLVTGGAKTKEKVKVVGATRLMGAGKENEAGRMSVIDKCSGRNIAAGGTSRDQKGTKQIVPQKGDTIGLVGLKGKVRSPKVGKHPTNVTQKQGKIRSPSKGKHSTNVTQKVYLR